MHFRDIRDILSNLLMFWFFATPIIYPWLRTPSVRRYSRFFDLNPFTHLAVSYQEILFFPGPVGHWKWLLALGVARSCCSWAATGSSTACVIRSRRRCDDEPQRHGDTEDWIRGLRGLRG